MFVHLVPVDADMHSSAHEWPFEQSEMEQRCHNIKAPESAVSTAASCFTP